MEVDIDFRLDTLLKRMEDMFTLLNIWQEYVNIIYAPEAEIKLMQTLRSQG
jgi:hypothetical protein